MTLLSNFIFAPGCDESGMIRPLQDDLDLGEAGNKVSLREKSRRALSLVTRDFRDYFGNTYVLKWSLWWALGMCGNFQVRRKFKEIMFNEV